MGTQARREVGLQDPETPFGPGPADIHSHHIKAKDIRPQQGGDILGKETVVRVEQIRHINGTTSLREVGGSGELNTPTRCGHGLQRHALPGQFRLQAFVQGNAVHQPLVGHTAPRITIDFSDQIIQRTAPIPTHLGWMPSGHGHDLTVTDQEAVIMAGQHLLNHLGRSVGRIDRPGALERPTLGQPHPDALALPPRCRLEHNGPAERTGGLQGLIPGAGDPLPWEGKTMAGEDLMEGFLAMKLLGEEGRPVGEGFMQQAPSRPVAELKELLANPLDAEVRHTQSTSGSGQMGMGLIPAAAVERAADLDILQ
ncbi:MAG: hypothetical protein QUV06_06010 [Cyanobium sp. CZS 48M]|nr:hypothetical protein [Cyanobium sp. CZS48M]